MALERCTAFGAVARRFDRFLTCPSHTRRNYRCARTRGARRAPGLAFVYDWCMGRRAAYRFLILPLTLAVAAAREGSMAFSLTSTAFKEGTAIPVKHTCDGADVSPPLAWSGAPPGTAAFALIADDPDAPAGTWVHWVLYDIAPTLSAIPENVAKVETLKELGGAAQGKNDFRRLGYGGPCPPPGKPHRYFFKLYALNAWLGCSPRPSSWGHSRARGADRPHVHVEHPRQNPAVSLDLHP